MCKSVCQPEDTSSFFSYSFLSSSCPLLSSPPPSCSVSLSLSFLTSLFLLVSITFVVVVAVIKVQKSTLGSLRRRDNQREVTDSRQSGGQCLQERWEPRWFHKLWRWQALQALYPMRRVAWTPPSCLPVPSHGAVDCTGGSWMLSKHFASELPALVKDTSSWWRLDYSSQAFPPALLPNHHHKNI